MSDQVSKPLPVVVRLVYWQQSDQKQILKKDTDPQQHCCLTQIGPLKHSWKRNDLCSLDLTAGPIDDQCHSGMEVELCPNTSGNTQRSVCMCVL